MNKDVQRYIGVLTKGQRTLFDELQAMIRSLYPDADIVMSYQIPTFKAKSGWVGLGGWKDGVSLYTNGPQHIAEFKAKYPAIKTGNGSINFRLTDKVPATALEKVIRHALEQPKES